MAISQWIVLVIFACSIAALIFTEKRPSHVFAGAMLALILTGELTLDQVLLNVTNQGLVTLVLLLLVSAAVEKTSLMKRLARSLVTGSFKGSFARIFTLAFFSSAILNNTAVVANLVGPIKQNRHHSASRLLIPLSYAAILGGTVTLIGTSTNLIVNSFLIERGHPGFGFWDFTLYGLIAGLLCGLLMFLLHSLLPELKATKANYQEYLIEAEVAPDSELVGNSVEQNSSAQSSRVVSGRSDTPRPTDQSRKSRPGNRSARQTYIQRQCKQGRQSQSHQGTDPVCWKTAACLRKISPR